MSVLAFCQSPICARQVFGDGYSPCPRCGSPVGATDQTPAVPRGGIPYRNTCVHPREPVMSTSACTGETVPVCIDCSEVVRVAA
jgi:hypothetical protein